MGDIILMTAKSFEIEIFVFTCIVYIYIIDAWLKWSGVHLNEGTAFRFTVRKNYYSKQNISFWLEKILKIKQNDKRNSNAHSYIKCVK